MAGASYTAGKFGLELRGTRVGFAHSAEGGEPFGVVIDEVVGGVPAGKRLGEVRSAPLVLEFPPAMAAPVVNWLTTMLDGTQVPTDGAIALLNYAMREELRLEWTSALITEITFPAADARSNDAARVRVTIEPGASRFVPGSGASYPMPSGAMSQKAMRVSNFRCSISGLGTVGTKVSKVSSITVRRKDVDRRTAISTVSDIVVWMPANDVAPVQAWFDEFVIAGRNDPARERTGGLTFMDSSMSDVLTLELAGLGITRIAHERNQENAAVLPTVKVEMYCEAVRFVASPAAPPPPPSSGGGTDDASVTRLAKAIAATLRRDRGSALLVDDALAERLLSSVDSSPAGTERDRGREAGRTWAAETARLDELEAVAALADHDNWSAVALDEGHSLLSFLAASGDLAAEETGPVDLARDEFVTGLVAGAAQVFRNVAPRLRDRRPADARKE